MNIAVCDDNVADRKQLERLLSRESDRRSAATGVFYVRSFGNSTVLGRSPKSYNLIFIDLVAEKPDGYDFALELIRAGVTAPIVLCYSSIDYRRRHHQSLNPPSNISFLEKPIRTADLTTLLNQAVLLRSQLPSCVELRTDKETHYLQEDEVLCGFIRGSLHRHHVKVLLTDGRTISVNSTFPNLCSQLINYPSFTMVSKKAFINVNHIEKCSFRKVSLDTGITFGVSAEYRLPLSACLEQPTAAGQHLHL